MPGEAARTLFLCKMDLEWVGMTERERIGNGIIFLEVARTGALFAGSKEDGGYKIKQR
jgi:hypothetical protein